MGGKTVEDGLFIGEPAFRGVAGLITVEEVTDGEKNSAQVGVARAECAKEIPVKIKDKQERAFTFTGCFLSSAQLDI